LRYRFSAGRVDGTGERAREARPSIEQRMHFGVDAYPVLRHRHQANCASVQGQRRARSAVDELGAELDGHSPTWAAERAQPPPDNGRGFEHATTNAEAREGASRCQASYAGSHDRDIRFQIHRC
jgi:hypothetical protein